MSTTVANARGSRASGVRASRWRGSRPPERVLAIRLHAFGDTILTLPYLHALRRRLPDSRIDFLTRREVAHLPRNVILFERVFEIGGGRSRPRMTLSALALLPRLRMRRYDVVLDLQRSRLSRAVRVLLNPRAWSEFDRLSRRLAGDRTRATIEAAGLGPLDVYPDLVLKHAGAGPEALRRSGWDGANELVVLNPAGTFAGRRWPLESYVRFARLWLARVSATTRFLVLGLPPLASAAEFLAEHVGGRLLNLAGRTSPVEAFALLQRATLVLSEDSGLMHMAWVAGAPTLSLFGASDATWARPHGNYTACLRACRRPDGVCVRDGQCRAAPPDCLVRLSPESVVARAVELLDRASKPTRVIHADGHSYAAPLDV